jgi:hypothetical protein
VYICATFVESVLFSKSVHACKIAYVKTHGSVLMRGLIVRTCKTLHAMLVIKRLSPSKRVCVCVLALVHAVPRASKHVCIQYCVFVIELLLKRIPCMLECKCTRVQSYNYIRMCPSMTADWLSCVRVLHRTWKCAKRVCQSACKFAFI